MTIADSLRFYYKDEDSGRSKAETDSKRRWRIFLSYAPDWAVTIILAIIFFSLDKVHGYKREFSVTDTSLRHTYAIHERVPPTALYLIAIVAPIVLMWFVNLISVRSWWDAHNSTLGVILSLSLAGVITQFTKITVGRPRPDLVSRCNVTNGTADPLYGLSTYHICHQSDAHILEDGFRSFPSGHSSLSFAGLGFLSWYLAGKMHLFDTRGHTPKAWLALGPLAGAALVAISRTMDYRHHWQDVLVGSLLGLLTSYFSYRQFFPSLSSERCHRPFSPRVKREAGELSVLPTHHHSRHSQSPSREVMLVDGENRSSDGYAEAIEMTTGHGSKENRRSTSDQS